MKQLVLALCAVVLFASFAYGGSKTYQVTGPVLAVTNDSITVQKGSEKWEIARDKDTKVTGDLKVGAKVTIHYTMKAANVEVKGEEKKKK